MSEVRTRPEGAGDVPITLDGEECVLRPSSLAAQALSRQYDGLRGCIDAVLRLNMDVIVQVVAHGLGIPSGSREMKTLPEKVWRTGVTDDTGALAERCVAYLRVLAGGGRPPPIAEGRDEE
jgi:hypothetical protein